MRATLSNEILLVSLPSGAITVSSFDPQFHREVVSPDPAHAAAPQRTAQVFQFGTSLLAVNAHGVLDTDRPSLVRILRDYAGAEPTIASSSSSGLRPGFVSAVTLDPGAFAPDDVARALAALNVIASWDESETIYVDLDGTRVRVRMRYEGGTWNGEIAGDPATILYRPVGLEELRLIYESDMRAFPRRLPDQPIFYPVTNETYARQIARDWNTKSGTLAGFVTRFAIDASYAVKLERRVVGTRQHEELWVPAEELAELNTKIVGTIDIVAAYFGDAYRGVIPESAALKGQDAREQLVTLARLFAPGGIAIASEIAANHTAIFLNYPFWQYCDFGEEPIDSKARDEVLAKLRHIWSSGEHGALALGIGP